MQKSDEGKAIKDLRALRNEFVHELHLAPALSQQAFDDKWQKVLKLLTPLAAFAGAQQLLTSETEKILTQEVDSKKEREFTDEFNTIRGQMDEVHNNFACTLTGIHYTRTYMLSNIDAHMMYLLFGTRWSNRSSWT